MYESTLEYLRKWNSSKTERQKLQGVYLVLGIVLVLLSGLITFVNANLGYALVRCGLVLIGIFIANGVAWHLLSSIFLSKISSRPNKK